MSYYVIKLIRFKWFKWDNKKNNYNWRIIERIDKRIDNRIDRIIIIVRVIIIRVIAINDWTK